MTHAITIMGIAGSVRKSSYNHAALVAAQSMLPDDASLDIFDLADLPLFNQHTEGVIDANVGAFKRAIRSADAILFATPEYNYCVPGVLKNAIDCASRPLGDSAWTGKPVGVMGASVSSMGSVRAQYQLRQRFVALDMYAVNCPEVMIPSASSVFDRNGVLHDQTSRALIRELLLALVRLTRQLKH